jgi:hypothetical protein
MVARLARKGSHTYLVAFRGNLIVPGSSDGNTHPSRGFLPQIDLKNIDTFLEERIGLKNRIHGSQEANVEVLEFLLEKLAPSHT